MSAAAGLDINFTGDLNEPEQSGPVSIVWTQTEPEEVVEEQTQTAVGTAAPAAQAAPAVTVPTNTPPTGLREFEKAQVARTEIKVSGATAINTNDGIEVSLDDRIRVVGEFRVTKITHHVTKEGDVVRTQYVAPVSDLELCPWNPADPTDDGIVRVRP